MNVEEEILKIKELSKKIQNDEDAFENIKEWEIIKKQAQEVIIVGSKQITSNLLFKDTSKF